MREAFTHTSLESVRGWESAFYAFYDDVRMSGCGRQGKRKETSTTIIPAREEREDFPSSPGQVIIVLRVLRVLRGVRVLKGLRVLRGVRLGIRRENRKERDERGKLVDDTRCKKRGRRDDRKEGKPLPPDLKEEPRK